MNQPKDFSFPSIVNGVDYLRSVVDLLTKQEQESRPRDLKYVVLHLQAAVEVLLKHRLMMESWELVLVKPGKSFEEFKKGSFKSVGTDKTIDRLEENCGITVAPEAQGLLTTLGRKRNALQHWGHADELVPLETLTVDVLRFLMDFLYRHVLEDLSPTERGSIDDDIQEVEEGLAEIIGILDARMLTILPEIDRARKAGKLVVECPSCRRETLISDDTFNTCLLCEQTWQGEEMAEEYTGNVLSITSYDIIANGDRDPRKYCPDCDVNSLVLFGFKTKSGEFLHVCFTCGVTFSDLDECMECYEWFHENEDRAPLCGSCLRNPRW